MTDRNNITLTNLNKAFYPEDKKLVTELGMFTGSRDNKEYTLYVDTKDRNTASNRNPFNFQVYFSRVLGRSFLDTNSNSQDQDIVFPFKVEELNYIYIKFVQFPLRLLYEYTGPTPSRIIDYFIVRIKELNIQYHFYSNSKLNSTTDIILYPSQQQNDFLSLDSKIMINFRESIQRTINRLTFEFLHSDGTPITVPYKLTLTDGIDKNTVLLDYSTDDITDPDNPLLSINNIFLEIKLGINDKQNI